MVNSIPTFLTLVAFATLGYILDITSMDTFLYIIRFSKPSTHNIQHITPNLPSGGRSLKKGKADKREESDDRLHFGVPTERAVESSRGGYH